MFKPAGPKHQVFSQQGLGGVGRLGWGGGGFVGLGWDGVAGTEYQNRTVHIKNQYNNRKKLKETLFREAKTTTTF